ncbi:MAG: RNA polymerase sigma-70 factor [Tannerellaceae bacterium]|jgi:RNA polymerase sigma-70 factor (ECF subfamily)|nr:RNA polymerase sigma-70 factor [Tannerellaceae bacterium]
MDFREFYIHWYSRLKSFAREYVIYEADAEDIIQDVFLELYEKYESLAYRVNIVAYLFTTIRNRCIDHIRHKIIEQESARRIQEEYLLTLRMKINSLEVLHNELFKDGCIECIVENALHTLPERCREIFIMHKIEGKKLREIAEEMSISPKTVENQITIAYKKLRMELQKKD